MDGKKLQKRYMRALPDLTGCRAVVTGYGGIGYAVALAFAAKGASVIVAGRDPGKGRDAVSRIRAELPGARLRFEQLDLARAESIRDFAERVAGEWDSLDFLMNIAGLMMPDKLALTSEGAEMQFGVNYLGAYSLTGLLLPLLKNGRAPRVVTVSSVANRPIRFDLRDARAERGYRPSVNYALSKLCCLMFAVELQKRSDARGWGLTAVCAHPGFARTLLFDRSRGVVMTLLRVIFRIFPFIRQSAENAARPLLFAATARDAKPGGYYGPLFAALGPSRRALMPLRANSPALRAELFGFSERVTGIFCFRK
jgi:NAD(P)-dependent dehydrogenase (short-subunit alcohol dehydrogenase family)